MIFSSSFMIIFLVLFAFAIIFQIWLMRVTTNLKDKTEFDLTDGMVSFFIPIVPPYTSQIMVYMNDKTVSCDTPNRIKPLENCHIKIVVTFQRWNRKILIIEKNYIFINRVCITNETEYKSVLGNYIIKA